MKKVQRWRYLSLALFFMAFFLVPIADVFRYDLNHHHFILLGKPLSLGLNNTGSLRVAPEGEGAEMAAFFDSNSSGLLDADERRLLNTELAITDAIGKTYKVKTNAQGLFQKSSQMQLPAKRLLLLTNTDAQHILLYIVLPLLGMSITSTLISRRWGRFYCGWLCPHYSVVEVINGLMRRASGKPTIWGKARLPEHQSDGTHIKPNAWYWVPTVLAILSFSLLWAVGFVSYAIPPKELYFNLFHFSLSGAQLIVISVITLVMSLDFGFARHLFCRYGCSVGILQSLFWMTNKKALVVGFDRSRVNECVDCDASCETACSMELPPRAIKRKKFSCTQCMLCIDACESVQAPKQQVSLLKMLDKDCALNESQRDFGKRPKVDKDCF